MLNFSVGKTIQIDARQDSGIKSGDLVLIRIVKNISPGKWAISFKGKIYPAQTDLNLSPDQILKVRVIKKGDTLHFKLLTDTLNDPLRNILEPLGLSDDANAKIIVSQLIKNGMLISPEIINRIKKLWQNKQELLEVIVRLLKKKIAPEGLNLQELHALLEGTGGQGAEEKDHAPPDWKGVRKMIRALSDRDGGEEKSLLALLNHLKEDQQSWVVLPLKFTISKKVWKGRLRFLITNYDKEVQKCIITLEEAHRWTFYLFRKEKTLKLVVYSNNKVYIGDKHIINSFSKRMGPLGISVDLEVYDEELFEGCSFYKEDIKSIDTFV